MAEYLVASEEGAVWANAEVGSTVKKDLSPDAERAVVAAGWVAPVSEAPANTTQAKES